MVSEVQSSQTQWWETEHYISKHGPIERVELAPAGLMEAQGRDIPLDADGFARALDQLVEELHRDYTVDLENSIARILGSIGNVCTRFLFQHDGGSCHICSSVRESIGTVRREAGGRG